MKVETYGIKNETLVLEDSPEIKVIELRGTIITEVAKTPYKVYMDFSKDSKDLFYISFQ